MNNPPAFQLYAADFYMDTLTWETDDIGVYFCLLMAEWVNGPLENDTRKLAKIAKKTHQKFIKNWTKISQKFVTSGTGTLVNLRLEEEREKQRQYREKQREKGRKRAEKMWKGHIATAIPTAIQRLQPKDSSSSSSSSSIDIKKEKILSLGSFGNVKLSKVELDKLQEKFGEDGTKDRVEKLSQYVAAKGKKYKSHYATILMWASKDGGGNGNGQSGEGHDNLFLRSLREETERRSHKRVATGSPEIPGCGSLQSGGSGDGGNEPDADPGRFDRENKSNRTGKS